MGLFDFFKRRTTEPEKAEPIIKQSTTQEKPTITPQQPKLTQPTPTPSQKPSVPLLSKEERYGKASLIGYQTGNWSNAVEEFLELENEGFGEASIALGQFVQGSDRAKALAHFEKAAQAGIAEGAWGCAAIIGHKYIADINGVDNTWYTYCLQAAQGGCCDAMNELGNMYNRKNDYLGAFYWYQMAAYYDHPEGYNSVGGILNKYMSAGNPTISSTIDGVRPNDVMNAISIFRCMTHQDKLDYDKMKCFMKSAMEDDNEIMGLFIGHFFEDTVKMDGNAILGYQIAANNNSIIGMKCFADMQAYGKGCNRNMQTAAGWYESAAEACEKTSCFIMGEFTRQENSNLAAYWYSVALRRGYEPALTRLQDL